MTTIFLSTYSRGTTSLVGRLFRDSTAIDQLAFKVPNKTLLELVTKQMGAQPLNIFLRDPTPVGNPFANNGWTPLTTTIQPIKFSRLGQTLSQAGFGAESFFNSGSSPQTITINQTRAVDSTQRSSWTQSGQFGSDVSALGSISTTIQEGNTTLVSSFAHRWGNFEITSRSKTLQFNQTIVLQPGQRTTVFFSATSGIFDWRVDYEAVLSGGIVGFFNPPANGRQFWYFPIKDLLLAGGLQNSIITSQNVTISETFAPTVIVL